MQKINLEIIEYIQIFKNDLALIKENSFSNFRYKERMKLERTLFFILTSLVQVEISGFNISSYEKLLNYLKEQNSNSHIIVIKIFELQTFLKSISNNSPYVRDDTLSKADTNRLKVFSLIEMKINKIAILITEKFS